MDFQSEVTKLMNQVQVIEIVPSALTPGQKYHVFLLCADVPEERKKISEIHNALERLGFKVFCVYENVILGESQIVEMSNAMDSSRHMVALLTPCSLNRQGNESPVGNEFKHFLGAAWQKTVLQGRYMTIPLLYGTSPGEIPLTMKYGNTVDICKHPNTWFKELVDLLLADGLSLGDVFPVGNIGEGAAWGYINGYIKIIAPEIKKSIKAWNVKTTPDRPAEVPETQLSYRLFVVIPESGDMPELFSMIDKNIQDKEKVILAERDQAGDRRRQYSSTMHKVRDEATKKDYYFLGEFASAVKSMRDTMKSQLTSLNTTNFGQQVIKFITILEQLSRYRQTQSMAKVIQIIRFKDISENPENLSQILIEAIRKEVQERENQPQAMDM